MRTDSFLHQKVSEDKRSPDLLERRSPPCPGLSVQKGQKQPPSLTHSGDQNKQTGQVAGKPREPREKRTEVRETLQGKTWGEKKAGSPKPDT